jgi:asparaginyl-tRNA synthetase
MESAWINFDELQDTAEQLVKHILKKVLDENKQDLEILGRDAEKLKPSLKKEFPRMTYTEAIKLLKEKKKMVVPWGKDLRTIEEDKLSELYDTPIIVTRYPKAIKAFYMKEDSKDPKVVLGFDMLGPEGYGELVGASQREENNEKIIENLKNQGEDPSKYGFYLDLRKYGSIPHAGFGLGVERVVSWICGLDNIKDAIPFPRTMLRKSP